MQVISNPVGKSLKKLPALVQNMSQISSFSPSPLLPFQTSGIKGKNRTTEGMFHDFLVASVRDRSIKEGSSSDLLKKKMRPCSCFLCNQEVTHDVMPLKFYLQQAYVGAHTIELHVFIPLQSHPLVLCKYKA